jgi:hypothetical protein
LRFHFLAEDPVRFPRGKAPNLLRGAFGTVFRRLVCLPECESSRECEWRKSCGYARIFEPHLDAGPSGLADPPRPFVFRARHLDGCAIPPGGVFHFDIHVFDLNDTTVPYFRLVFAELGREGLGPGRSRAKLTEVEHLDLDGLIVTEISEPPPCVLSLAPALEPVRRVRVRFLTPTELKADDGVAERPEFSVLLKRIRDRVFNLAGFYGGDSHEIDFRAFGDRAAEVRMTRCDIERVEVTRLSSRTGQRHSLGGFTGVAEYEGDLAEFLPFLTAAQFTGVGRQTTWGKGEIRATRW